jgi:hypothetical protein
VGCWRGAHGGVYDTWSWLEMARNGELSRRADLVIGLCIYSMHSTVVTLMHTRHSYTGGFDGSPVAQCDGVQSRARARVEWERVCEEEKRSFPSSRATTGDKGDRGGAHGWRPTGWTVAARWPHSLVETGMSASIGMHYAEGI